MAKRKPAKTKPPPQQPVDVGDINIEQLEARRVKEQADAALHKIACGETPSSHELAQLRRYEDDQRTKYGMSFVQNFPRALYVKYSGRPSKVLNEQADRHGLPLRGPHIDLTKVILSFHQFLRANQHKISQDDASDSEDNGRYRAAKADMAEDERDSRRTLLIPKDDARSIHTRWEQMLRSAGEDLGRRFGAEAQDILNEALDDCQQLITSYYGEESTV